MKPAVALGGTRPAARPANRLLPALVMLLLVVVAARLIFAHHDSKWERIAAGVTQALQKNDVAGVRQYQNAETATHVTASRVGRGADTLAPLGALKKVRESAVDADTRVHQFDVTFDKGSIHETIKFDPADKIVSFRYDEPVRNK